MSESSLNSSSWQMLKTNLVTRGLLVYLAIGVCYQLLRYHSLFNLGAIVHIPFWFVFMALAALKATLVFALVAMIGMAAVWFLAKIPK